MSMAPQLIEGGRCSRSNYKCRVNILDSLRLEPRSSQLCLTVSESSGRIHHTSTNAQKAKSVYLTAANRRSQKLGIAPVHHLWASLGENGCIGALSCLPEATEAKSVRSPSPCHNARPRCPPGYPRVPFATYLPLRGRRRELGAPYGAPPKGGGDLPSGAPMRCAAHGPLRARRASAGPPPWPGSRVRSRSVLPSFECSIIPSATVLA